jgi:hypothetical protein
MHGLFNYGAPALFDTTQTLNLRQELCGAGLNASTLWVTEPKTLKMLHVLKPWSDNARLVGYPKISLQGNRPCNRGGVAGDQTIFVRARDFHRVGGFDASLVIMEDADLVVRLHEQGPEGGNGQVRSCLEQSLSCTFSSNERNVLSCWHDVQLHQICKFQFGVHQLIQQAFLKLVK